MRRFKSAQGRKLTSLEVYDICCTIANCVVAGGVRRSATISLSDLEDSKMRHAKDGQFWVEDPQRALSNNPVVYEARPDAASFAEEWTALMRSGSGERGIVNRQALRAKAAHSLRRDEGRDFGVNPCGETILRPKSFCNLTEVVVRPDDTVMTLADKVEAATILGLSSQPSLTSAFLTTNGSATARRNGSSACR